MNLFVSKNQLTSLILGSNIRLLFASNNLLTSLDVSNATSLEVLLVDNNLLPQ